MMFVSLVNGAKVLSWRGLASEQGLCPHHNRCWSQDRARGQSSFGEWLVWYLGRGRGFVNTGWRNDGFGSLEAWEEDENTDISNFPPFLGLIYAHVRSVFCFCFSKQGKKRSHMMFFCSSACFLCENATFIRLGSFEKCHSFVWASD